ncbi:MAG: Asp23/Gls24 family envelope stress response protein [Oscillospiraceae bacterium]
MTEYNQNDNFAPQAPEENAPQEKTNRVSYDDKVIKKYLADAVSKVDGVLALAEGGNAGATIMGSITDLFKGGGDVKGLTVRNNDGKVSVDVRLVIEFGKSIPEITQKVGEKIAATMEQLVGLSLADLHIQIADTMTKEEFDKKNNPPANTPPTPPPAVESEPTQQPAGQPNSKPNDNQ